MANAIFHLMWVSACAVSGTEAPDIERARAAAIRAAVARASASIVKIETIGGAQPIVEAGPRGRAEEGFRLGEGPTTGLVYSADGYIITSSFNFARDPSIITVTLQDGRRLIAKLLGRDYIRRLALLKVDAADLPEPQWLATDDLRVGQYAIACGRALGGDQASMSLGIISAVGRRNGNAIQTDAKVSPINYGGPLLDIEGAVIGILVPMAGSGGALAGAEWYDSGIGFAIYRDKIGLVFERLAAGESIEQGRIGIVLAEDEPSLFPFLDKLLPAAKGVKIKEVAPDSPASRADLRAGDKIVALDGQPTGDIAEMQRRLSDRAAGEQIRLSVKRRWRTIEVSLTLVRPAEIGKPSDLEAPASAPTTTRNAESPPESEPPATTQPDGN
ncbi:MAG TPA: trypsin-like peptidase domain-containing protein [Phycisphaerae bacterium]|nr:trypsin-like peptidase domain-containing protein [Phycisphaerae bacterium]